MAVYVSTISALRKRERERGGSSRGCVKQGWCVSVCDRDSNCSSPLLEELLAQSAVGQSEQPHKIASL